MATAAKPPATVSELEVRPAAACLAAKPEKGAVAPKVVSAFPGEGAVVRPGYLVVRVTFDRPMTCDGFLLGLEPFPNPCPEGHQKMALSFNRRTIRVICATVPNTAYLVRLGVAPSPEFKSLAGLSAEPFEITFRTAGPELRARSIPEALAQDRAMPGR